MIKLVALQHSGTREDSASHASNTREAIFFNCSHTPMVNTERAALSATIAEGNRSPRVLWRGHDAAQKEFIPV